MAQDDLTQAVLSHCDIVQVVSSYLPLTKAGKSHVCLCPFHDDKHPSMQVSQEKQIFKCFVCGEGGNAISFVSKMEKIPFHEARLKVAQISGYEDPRLKANVIVKQQDESLTRLYKVLEDAQTYYRYSLSIPEGEKAREYLAKRGLDADIQSRFGIGYAPLDGKKTVAYLQAKKHSLKAIEESGIALNNGRDRFSGRITFALCNPDGAVNGFSARIYEQGQEGGKYVNSPACPIFDKSANLYNYHNAVAAARVAGYCYLCEGFMDVIALYKAGITAAVAGMGTALTEGQAKLLKRLKCEIRLCLDGDAPGQEATIKAGTILNKVGVPYSIVDYQGDVRDPDEILTQEGKDALIDRLQRRITPFDFTLRFYAGKVSTLDGAERKRLAERFLPYLRQTPAGLDYEDLLNRIADATGFHKEAIREMATSEVTESSKEETVYVRGRIQGKGVRGNPALNKLILAEKALLHYMLTSPLALEYYKGHPIVFRGKPVHETIANYITEYEKSHPGNLDPMLLQGYIADEAGEEGEPYIAEISSLTLTDTPYPPCSEEALGEIEDTLHRQTELLRAISSTKDVLHNGSKEDGAKANKAYAELMRKKHLDKKKGA